MYTVVVDDKNHMHTSICDPLIQNSSAGDFIKIIVKQNYNDYDMKMFSAIFEYQRPESGKTGTVVLDDPQEMGNGYLAYFVPVDKRITSESGELKIRLTFSMYNIDDDQELIVRKIAPADIAIIPTGKWNGELPDDINIIDQKLEKMQKSIDELERAHDQLDKEKADNIAYGDDTLQLTAHDILIGDPITLKKTDLVWREI